VQHDLAYELIVHEEQTLDSERNRDSTVRHKAAAQLIEPVAAQGAPLRERVGIPGEDTVRGDQQNRGWNQAENHRARCTSHG
jgi:hypothetical protein